jgi:glycosyltransferase involved in cell wall biosynthesis
VRSLLLAFEPPDGGVAEQVAQLALGLGARGWRVEVAGPPEAAIADRIRAAGLPFHELSWSRDYRHVGADLAAARQLDRLLRRGRQDILHVHAAKAGALGRMVGALPRRPRVVYSPHSLPFVGDFGPLRRHGGAAVERALALLTDRIVCVSEHERDAAAAAGIARRRLRVVVNGCAPCPPDVEADAATAELATGGPLVAAIAVLRRQKRLDVLIDAAPRVFEQVPDARIAIIGGGPLQAELEERARGAGLSGDPRFAMLPFHGPSARHLAATDLFVLPSAWEGLPIGVLEALACGVPVVATRVGGTPEAVSEDVGTLVDPGDAAGLAEAIVALLTDPERRRAMAAAARARHAERFGLQQMLDGTAAVYDELVA